MSRERSQSPKRDSKSPPKDSFGSLEDAIVDLLGEEYRKPYCSCQPIRWAALENKAKEFFREHFWQDTWSREGLVLFYLHWSTTPKGRAWYELQFLLNDMCNLEIASVVKQFAANLWTLAGAVKNGELQNLKVFWKRLEHHLRNQIPFVRLQLSNSTYYTKFEMRYDNMITQTDEDYSSIRFPYHGISE